MSSKLFTFMLMASFALMLAFVGCSDDDNPATSGGADTTALSLINIADIIRDVAPPVYSTQVSKSAPDSFEIWTEGEYALLGKVFGEEDPQTLYRNIDDFEGFMEIIDGMLNVDENGDLILGTFTKTDTNTIDEQVVIMHGTCVVTALSTPTVMPTAYQDVLGTSHDLDYLVTLTVEDIPDGQVQIGMSISETEQVLLVYQTDMSGQEGQTESSIVYASLDLTDSTFEFNGVMYSNEDSDVFSTSFMMTSESDGDFAYQMSWFSDEIPAPDYTLLGCIIGGGNKNTEFALKYRQYTPADDTEYDSEWAFDEVFGPDYSNGTGLITDYATFVSESLIIGYDLVPQDDVASPWATE